MLCFETKDLQRLLDYTVISLTNPHTIRGRPTLKNVEHFRNGSFHEFCRLKALITLKEVNRSDFETRKNVHEQNFNDEVKNNKQIVVNLSLPTVISSRLSHSSVVPTILPLASLPVHFATQYWEAFTQAKPP